MKDTRKLSIALGQNRFAKQWKNRSMTWRELLERFENPTRTQESFKEYKAMTKAKQGDVKDVGGFVAGVLSGGRRSVETVRLRSVLTLDLDNLKESAQSFWDGLTMFHGYEAAVYSTHSHSPRAPRLRLVIPLSRDVSPDEYEATGRMIADELGMESFDQTTFQPHRLMYWPSHARDADYIYLHQEGPWLNPDDVLARYENWTDTSQWPGLDQFQERLLGHVQKQEDPLEKKGIIGAYCRTHSITELLEGPLKDTYSPSSEGRYTYTHGSTEGGVVVYEDKWVFSHHATDPISGKLVNAFDLMRIHKFGELDRDAKEETPVNRLPSFIKMEEFAQEDKDVKLLYIKELDDDITDGLDFEGDDEVWVLQLDMQKNKILSTVKNCRLILENEKDLKGCYQYDAFRGRAVVVKKLPWQSGIHRDWNDTDDAGFREFLERKYNITGAQKIFDGIALAFENNKVHPVREYLETLTWDGKSRIETIFIDYFGAEDTPYVRAVAKIHLTAAVARVIRPGTKYDNMLVLIGSQGIGKSTFIRILCSPAWFNDSIDRIAGKETFELLQGSWHVELGELNATKKAEKEAVKQFLSKTEDIYRAPYGRRTQRYPRQCVFWGTGNETEFLRDETGDRRYFPVKCEVTEPTKNVFSDLDKERDQLWAEAVHLYKEGLELYLDRDLEREAAQVREMHKEDRPKVGMVRAFLDRPVPIDWYELDTPARLNWLRGMDQDTQLFDPEDELNFMIRDKTCIAEIWCELFEKRKGDMRPIDSKEIGDIMRSLSDEWEVSKNPLNFGPYGRQRGFIRKKL